MVNLIQYIQTMLQVLSEQKLWANQFLCSFGEVQQALYITVQNLPTSGKFEKLLLSQRRIILMAATYTTILSFEEYKTFFSRIQATLNSRPLCYKSKLQKECKILNPAHVLIGRSLLALSKVNSEQISLSKRFLTHPEFDKWFLANLV